MREMSWSDYVLLHQGIVRIVRKTGGYWFNGASYVDMESVRKHGPLMCKTMLQCMKNHNSCSEFEIASIEFIEGTLTDWAKSKVYGTFHTIGRHRELGLASATLSAGGSVKSEE